jgi:hypothetical protein
VASVGTSGRTRIGMHPGTAISGEFAVLVFDLA